MATDASLYLIIRVDDEGMRSTVSYMVAGSDGEFLRSAESQLQAGDYVDVFPLAPYAPRSNRYLRVRTEQPHYEFEPQVNTYGAMTPA